MYMDLNNDYIHTLLEVDLCFDTLSFLLGLVVPSEEPSEAATEQNMTEETPFKSR